MLVIARLRPLNLLLYYSYCYFTMKFHINWFCSFCMKVEDPFSQSFILAGQLQLLFEHQFRKELSIVEIRLTKSDDSEFKLGWFGDPPT